jgi:hypothetical protein
LTSAKLGLARVSQPLFLPLLTTAAAWNYLVVRIISASLELRIPSVVATTAFWTLDGVVAAAVEVDCNGEGKKDQKESNPDCLF